MKMRKIIIAFLSALIIFGAMSACNLNGINDSADEQVSQAMVYDRGLSEGTTKYLGNIIGPKDQNNNDWDVYIPDEDSSCTWKYTDYWNQITAENDCKWGYLETSRDYFDPDVVARTKKIYDFAKSHGIPFKWHTLMWGDADHDEGTWRKGLSASDIRDEVVEWFEWVHDNFPNIDYIDVVNEACNKDLSFASAFNGQVSGYTGQAKYEWIVWSFMKAREIFGESTQLLINDFNIINGSKSTEYKTIIQTVQDYTYDYTHYDVKLKKNVTVKLPIIDGIGLQCHTFNLDKNNTATATSVLNSLAQTGLDIHIAEFDTNGGTDGYDNPSGQKDVVAAFFPIFWNHPAVVGVTYWGYRDGKTWKPYTNLFNGTNTTRPAMDYLIEFFDTTSGFFNLANDSIYGGIDVLGTGEEREPVVAQPENFGKPLNGLYTKFDFGSISGNKLNLKIWLLPFDDSTEKTIRDEKYPSDSAIKKYISENNGDSNSLSAIAAEKFNHSQDNMAELASLAFDGQVTLPDGGKTITISGAKIGSISLNNFVMTIKNLNTATSGGAAAVIKHSYNYTNDGKKYNVTGNLFVSGSTLSKSLNSSAAGSKAITASVTRHPFPIPGMHPAPVKDSDRYSFISLWSGKHLTVTSADNNAAVKAQPEQNWSSQDWIAEKVEGETNIYRIRNVWTGKYLHAQSNEEYAKAVCYELHSDWWSQQWVVEQIGFRKAKLKNRWTNRYLTVADNGDYADVLLQGLNTDWTSQDWEVDWLTFE